MYIYICIYVYIYICRRRRTYACVTNKVFYSHAEVHSVMYDSETVPRKAIFSPRETSPNLTANQS